MPHKVDIFDRMDILKRANDYLKKRNLDSVTNFIELSRRGCLIFKTFPFLASNIVKENVAPSISDLDRLYFHTIYYSNGPFNLIDYLLSFPELDSSISLWIEKTCFNFSTNDIEARCKDFINNPVLATNDLEFQFLTQWLHRRSSDKLDSDILALRFLETIILLSIIHHEKCNSGSFDAFEEKLMDWSEGVGLIRSLSDDFHISMNTTTMDLDFNPLADDSHSSSMSSFTFKTEFEVYLTDKFKDFKEIKEIIDIVADRCGIPIESEAELDSRPQPFNKKSTEKSSKHWRRVKPVSVPVKRIPSSNVKRPSSLSVSEPSKPTLCRFLSASSSTRQFDLIVKPTNQHTSMQRRHSESSIIQHSTPTKTVKYAQLTSSAHQTADSFVILETPPRVMAAKQVNQSDLAGSVKRLFSSENENGT